ncbi:MAG: hypothetical protein WBB27_05845, partial [Maribacter sp.]
PKYNFVEASRSGVSLIESLEIISKLDTLNPYFHLIYLSDSDFTESISNISRKKDILQVDLDKNIILNGELKAPFFKNILYNWKGLYFLYNRYNTIQAKKSKFIKNIDEKNNRISENHFPLCNDLLNFITSNYKTSKLIFVFRPESSQNLIQLVESKGITTIKLERKEKENWSFEFDKHWTCSGHSFAAKQVAKKIKHILKKDMRIINKVPNLNQ